MSLPDTIFIFGLALVVFGPKKLPEIGRQLGKLMLEFRRASNEFKMQIEEELRAAEYADQQKQIVAPAATTNQVLEAGSDAPVIRPPSDGTTVSTESPTSRVIPVEQEVATLEAAGAEHPELKHDALERLSDGAEHREPNSDAMKHLPDGAEHNALTPDAMKHQPDGAEHNALTPDAMKHLPDSAEHNALTPDAMKHLPDGAEHNALTPDAMKHLPEQATVHHD